MRMIILALGQNMVNYQWDTLLVVVRTRAVTD